MSDRRTGFVAVAVGIAALIGAIALAVTRHGEASGSYQAWAGHLRAVADGAAAEPGDDAGSDGAPAGLLLAVSDETGAGRAFAVLAPTEDGGTLLGVLPASLYDLLPGYGIFPIGQALTFEGPELADLAVENSLGIRIGGVLVIPATDLPALLGGDVAVDLPNPLLVEQADGSIVRVAAEGDLLRSPEAVAELLTNRGSGELLAHLERQVATWEGLLAHVVADEGRSAAVAALAGEDVHWATSLLSAAAGGTEVTLVPVGATGSGDDEGFETDAGEVASFVEHRIPRLALSSGERPRAEILNGNGRLRTTRDVAETLVDQGFRIVRTDNAENFDFETTVVLAHGEDNTELGREVVAALGTGELRLESEAPSGVVDVSIIVGHDIPTGEG